FSISAQMCADCCHSGGTGSFVQTVQVPAGEFHGYAGHVCVPPQTVVDRRQNDMPQLSIQNGSEDSQREQQPLTSLLGLERETVLLGLFHHVYPVLPCDGTGYRSCLIKALFTSHGCTSSPDFLYKRLLASISSKVTGSK